MRIGILYYFTFLATAMLLSSCEFQCKLGAKSKDESTVEKLPAQKDGALVYNDIKVETHKVQLKKAWLMKEEGTRLAEGNFVDFPATVKLILELGEGWQLKGQRVFLGISEIITDEYENELLNEKDLFANNTAGFTEEDARIVGISASIKLNEDAAPTSFKVFFKVWDKNSEAYVEGSYSLFSK